MSSVPDRDDAGRPLRRGILVDMTERRRAEDAEKRAAIQAEMLRSHEQTLQALSTPLIPVTAGVVVMPLIGAVDGIRGRRILEALLEGVTQHRAAFAILDVTGVPDMKPDVVDMLVRATKSVALLGAQAVLTGVPPRMAQALVESGADLSGITTLGSLASGIAYATRRSPR